ncbi:signal recognition particle protein Srp19 [Pyrococcus yayanosii]|uniref:Signal recognition particle 19 kDa protein n=1 Tax=Pyrococcus yayanosii (strain CH1 / JCM 16557) TaxID=529709 RepID=F8AJ68_PYRYC|nr:signal recognition particle protein Srp19 [Pyrococcus yayanosii]AEH24509.1 signal recognition particle protein Srp19 [Pyrococcus yayanosii CH1]
MARFIVWASEIDARLSKKYGRVVPKSVAVESPQISEIVEAAEALGFKVLKVEEDKLNPRLSGLDEDLRAPGRAIIESPHGKGKTLKLIAQKVREFRKRSYRGGKRRR